MTAISLEQNSAFCQPTSGNSCGMEKHTIPETNYAVFEVSPAGDQQAADYRTEIGLPIIKKS